MIISLVASTGEGTSSVLLPVLNIPAQRRGQQIRASRMHRGLKDIKDVQGRAKGALRNLPRIKILLSCLQDFRALVKRKYFCIRKVLFEYSPGYHQENYSVILLRRIHKVRTLQVCHKCVLSSGIEDTNRAQL